MIYLFDTMKATLPSITFLVFVKFPINESGKEDPQFRGDFKEMLP